MSFHWEISAVVHNPINEVSQKALQGPSAETPEWTAAFLIPLLKPVWVKVSVRDSSVWPLLPRDLRKLRLINVEETF